MQVHKIPFEQTGKFPPLFLDYVNQKKELREFYDLFPSPENFIARADKYAFSDDWRNQLADTLKKQYQAVPAGEKVLRNIESLRDKNTFTITTGHQLSLFTGPLYFVYKILTVVKAAQELNQKDKGLHFVPVFWMASEDHDFEEINHFYLFNKKFTWETDQKGPVGRFSTEGIEKIFEEIKEELSLFRKAYLEHESLSLATRYLVNELFGDQGLVVIDGDDPVFKKSFVSIIKDDLINHSAFQKLNQQTASLEKLGYSSQINPREINLFYIENGLRERIVKEDSVYKVLNTNLTFSEKELFALVSDHPEKFSPNVALRPLYQQMILPNVAYCGGPAEINYWLQLKNIFDHYQAEFPILLPRFSAHILAKQNQGKLEKLGIASEEIFLSADQLKSKVLERLSGREIELSEEQRSVSDIFKRIVEKAKAVDASLEGFVLAEEKNVLRSLENIEKRMKKAEESRNAVSLNQLNNLLEKMFPEGQLQERRDNFLNFYINDPGFISEITANIAPFDFRFNLITHG